jgi:hypothetical protein
MKRTVVGITLLAIETKLREAGFTVVAVQEFQATWDAKVNELWGLFDQNTGKVNDAKTIALLNHIRAEMKTRFNADALLLPRVSAVTARFSYTPSSVSAPRGTARPRRWRRALSTRSSPPEAMAQSTPSRSSSASRISMAPPCT